MERLKSHRNDAILIAVLVILGGALALFLRLTRQAGGYVSVQVDGDVVMELPLDEDAEVLLGEGGRTNLLIVRDGAAWVAEASCPDQICVRRGAIRYAGESIVCLPHKLVASIEGGAENPVDGTAK